MTLSARLILAAVFAVAGIAKLLDRDGARDAVRAFGVPPPLVTAAAALLPLAELSVAAALLVTPAAVAGAAGAVALLALFVVGIAVSLARGRQPDCRCFGQLHAAPVGWKTLARNAALAALAGLVVAQGPGSSLDTWSAGLSGTEWVALLVAGALAVAFVVEGSLLVDRWRQHRAAVGLFRPRDVTSRPPPDAGTPAIAGPPATAIPPSSAGLPVGTPAPDFSLPGLDGERLTLQALRATGRPVLLIFTDPGCQSCASLLPAVEHCQVGRPTEVTVAVISRGRADDNRAPAEAQGIINVGLQTDSEVARAYRFPSPPGAVLIGADGLIAASAIVGTDAVLRLLESSGAPVLTSHSPAAPAAPTSTVAPPS